MMVHLAVSQPSSFTSRQSICRSKHFSSSDVDFDTKEAEREAEIGRMISQASVWTVHCRVPATTRILPDEDGVGFSKSVSTWSLLSLISTFIAVNDSPLNFLADERDHKRLGFVWTKTQKGRILLLQPLGIPDKSRLVRASLP
jgi:hypothetical protein